MSVCLVFKDGMYDAPSDDTQSDFLTIMLLNAFILEACVQSAHSKGRPTVPRHNSINKTIELREAK